MSEALSNGGNGTHVYRWEGFTAACSVTEGGEGGDADIRPHLMSLKCLEGGPWVVGALGSPPGAGRTCQVPDLGKNTGFGPLDLTFRVNSAT